MKLIVGCCGWSGLRPKEFEIENWRGKFPSKLALYASLFPCVEVNSTFYRLPKVSTAEKWREEARSAREDFEFTVKVPRTITHDDRFKGDDSLRAYEAVAEVALALDARILLFQTPKSLKDGAAPQVEKFFSKVDRANFTFVFEPRGFSREQAFKLCRNLDLVYCFDPFAELPPKPPGKILYVRLHGSPPGERMYHYDYTEDDLRQLRRMLEKAAKGKKAVYCLFNNIPMHRSAKSFMEMMGLWSPRI